MRLIVFLGNPGSLYEKNRHNAGWLFADFLIGQLGYSPFILDKKFKGAIATGGTGEEKLIFLKPETFMNRSGEAVIAVMNFFKVPLENLLVVYDDKDILLGENRYREKGSSGGHNGIADIIRVLGTHNIARVKIGVDSPLRTTHDLQTSEFVLSDFNSEELEVLTKSVFPDVMSKLADWLQS